MPSVEELRTIRSDETIQMMAKWLSALSLGRRSPTFFTAWYIEEHGWDGWDGRVNNPFNISGPLSKEPWFYGTNGVQSNGVVVYLSPEIGIVATHLVIVNLFPNIYQADSDQLACQALSEPGAYGTWAQNPAYGQEVWEIYQSLEIPTPPVSDSPLPRTYVVQPGDYVDGIAQKTGVPAETIIRLNGLRPPYLIYPREVLRLS